MTTTTTSTAHHESATLLQNHPRASSCIYKLKKSQSMWQVITCLGLISWIFSMAGTFHCSFIMVEQLEPTLTATASTLNSSQAIVSVDHPVGLGLFSTSVYDLDANLLGCVSYYGTSDEFDGAFRAARTFGMMAALSTTVALTCVLLVILFVETVQRKINLWSVARFLFFAAFLCQLLTFLAFGRHLCSRAWCRPGAASLLTMLNLILLAVQSALIYVVPPPTDGVTPLFVRRQGNALSEDGSAKFEILSSKRAASDMDDGMDLESECGTQTPSMIMEGIECVAADHLRRKDPDTKWDKIVQKYHAIGAKKSTRIAIGVLLAISWIFTLVGVTRCTFILVGASGQERTQYSGLGLFNRAYYLNDDILGCIAYPSAARNEFDAAFEVGRAFGMMTLLLVSASFVSFTALHLFVGSSRSNKELIWWAATQLTLPCAFISQMVTFSAFETQSCTQSNSVDCVPGVAAIFAILNVFLLLALATFIFALPCPKRSIFRARFAQGPTEASSHAASKQSKAHSNQHSKQRMTREAERLPEPSSTHSVSEQSMYHDHGVGVQRVADPPTVVKESVEVCNATTVNEKEGTRTTTKEIRHPDGSITITTTVEQIAPNDSSTTNNASSGVSSSNTTSQGMAMETTSTSGMPTSSAGPTVTQTSSWDSGASVEQFETVDMDTSNGSSRANIIERNVRAKTKAKASNTEESAESIRDTKCCLVQATAMSIMKEMQLEEERKQSPAKFVPHSSYPSRVEKNQVPSTVEDDPSNLHSSALTSTLSSTLNTGGGSGGRPSETVTTRGGHLNPGTASSSDAVGEPSSSDTYSKISSTEYCFGSDDGITFNTGDAINTDDSVAVQAEKKRPVKVFV